MKDLGEVQFSVTMESGKIFVPAKPLTILRDTFGVWPFRLSLGGAMLRYATVEPLSVIRSAGQPPTYFFFASEGVAPEYVFDGNPQIETRCGKPEHQGDATRVAELTPGTGCLMTVRGTGEAVRVVTLSNAQSRLYWKARVAGTEYAFLSAADLQFDSAGIVADSIDAPQIGLAVYPSMAVESSPAARESKDGVFTNYQVSLTAKRVSVESHADGTGRWSLKFPGDAMQGLSDVILSAKWTGNTAQLYPSGTHELIADDFYTGQTWQIGLKRFAPGIFETGATLEVSPLEKNANIFLERWPSIAGDAIQELQSVQALPVYRVRFRVGAK
jgi:beta-galactosidase